MNPERLLPQTTLDQQWDISVACDVSLGQIFRDNPTLPEGSAIHVDPNAIAQAMHAINPDINGKLLFVATHDKNLNPSGFNTTFNLGIATPNHRTGEHTARVVVAGGLSSILDIETLLAIADTENLVNLLSDASTDGQQKNVEAQKQKKKLLGRLMTVGKQSESKIQETAIHELSHIVDFEDPSALKQASKYRRRTAALGASAAFSTILVTSEVISVVAAPITSTGTSGLAVSIAGAAIGALGYQKIVDPRLSRRVYRKKPTEIKANINEALAPKLPTIITFVTPE